MGGKKGTRIGDTAWKVKNSAAMDVRIVVYLLPEVT